MDIEQFLSARWCRSCYAGALAEPGDSDYNIILCVEISIDPETDERYYWGYCRECTEAV